MTDRSPLTDLDLDDITTRAAHLYEYGDPTDTGTAGWEELAGTDAPALVVEVRRLRAELGTAHATVLVEVADELEGIDFHPNAKSNSGELCRLLAGRFRRKAAVSSAVPRPAPDTLPHPPQGPLMTTPARHTHKSPALTICAVPWPDTIHDYDPDRISLLPGDWMVRMVLPAPAATPDDPDALRRLLEYALATLDRDRQGPDAFLDDPEA